MGIASISLLVCFTIVDGKAPDEASAREAGALANRDHAARLASWIETQQSIYGIEEHAELTVGRDRVVLECTFKSEDVVERFALAFEMISRRFGRTPTRFLVYRLRDEADDLSDPIYRRIDKEGLRVPTAAELRSLQARSRKLEWTPGPVPLRGDQTTSAWDMTGLHDACTASDDSSSTPAKRTWPAFDLDSVETQDPVPNG